MTTDFLFLYAPQSVESRSEGYKELSNAVHWKVAEDEGFRAEQTRRGAAKDEYPKTKKQI